MICPQCQQPLREGAQFCTNCGASAVSRGDNSLSNSIATVVRSSEGVDDSATLISGDALVGRVLDSKYELLGRLGEGGMGAVYRARRVHIGDEVAVKLLHPKFVTDEAAVERFRREARAAAQLHHSNVVTIHDYGEARGRDDYAYIVMELVGGASLRELLRAEGKLSVARSVSLMRDICAGVGAAHRRNIVHRDLKPDNIIVVAPDDDHERETVKVVDFGIAKLRDLASDSTLTQAGDVVGTPYYMSPEQCRGESLDTRADVYSLGALLYEMLAGAPPFNAPSVTGVIAKHLTEPPPQMPASLGIPVALEAAIMRALAKNPGARQSDATEFAREIHAAADGAATTGTGAPFGIPVANPVVSNPLTGPAVFSSEPRPVSLTPPHVSQSPAPSPQYVPTPSQSAPPQFAPPAHFPPPHGAFVPARKRKSRAPLVVGALILLVVVALGVSLAALMITRGIRRNRTSRENTTQVNARGASNASPANDATRGATIPVSAAMQRAEGKILSNGFLTGDDVSALSPKELRLLRNTIYARYGRVFSEPELSRYFAGRPWYQPSTDYSDDKISDTDRANTEMIKVFENGGTTPIDATTVRKEVKEVLDGWADTTRDRDLDEHMSFYAPSLETFYNARNVSAAQVRKDRARAFERYSEMDVKLENVQVKPDPSGTRATVTFDKTWDFDGDEKHSTGSVRQQLSLTKAGDRWLITGEKDLEVLYTNSEER